MRIDKRTFITGLGFWALAFAGASEAKGVWSPKKGQLSNRKASGRARALYRYLNDIYGKKTLTGQMESTWTGTARAELDYLQATTGKLPAMLGLDYLEPKDNDNVDARAAKWYLEEGGIATICWHWGAPDIGTGYENSKKPFDVEAALKDGTPQNAAMMRDMKDIADHLERLKNKDVPILWRPFHEFTGTWFWWGQHGADGFKRLWIKMYDYFTHERGLNNLIWVLGYADTPDPAYYPGRAYVDIAGADTYVKDHGPLKEKYDLVKAIVGDSVPICLHENGPTPDPELVESSGAEWLYFMNWHTKWVKDPEMNPPDLLKRFYNSERYLTKDELPALKDYHGSLVSKPVSWLRGLGSSLKGLFSRAP